MIDLHVHTNCSDGTDDVLDILKKAEHRKIEVLSITDHETCEAYNKLKNTDIKKYFSGKIIPGVELKTKLDGIGIELLGYFVDTDIINKEVEELYKPLKQSKANESIEVYNICKKIGVDIPENTLQTYDSSKFTYVTSHIHNQIKKNPENKKFFLYDESWDDSMAFYRKEIANPLSKFYIDGTKYMPTIQQVINLIKKAGGLVFVPHIYVYGEHSQKIFEYINKNYKVDGYECYYSKFTNENSDFLMKYCKEYNLLMSGGTDYHGKTKPNIEIGIGKGNLCIPRELINQWCSFGDVY